MYTLTVKELAGFCGGKYRPGAGRRRVGSVVTDSRKPVKGGAFIALKGENFDGHNYVCAALEAGAACAVVSDAEGWESGRFGEYAVFVGDTQKALGDIAAGYLQKYFPKMRRIAVTGSVGKTTTKELVHAVLASGFRAEKTPLSHNNEIGLPMTSLSLPSDTEIFVAEMGMRGFGQITYLENIVHPEAALITTIGNAHLELLGSRENILKAKMEVCRGGARLPRGKAFKLIVNGDNDMLKDKDRLRSIAAGYGCRKLDIITFGLDPSSTFRAAETVSGEHGINYLLICPEGNVHVDLPLPGEHNIYNSLAAIAAGSLFGISAKQAVSAIRRYAEESGGEKSVRQRKITLAGGRITVIDDAYNAGPESMPASLKVLGGITADRHIAALADMVELGPDSPRFHFEVGRTAATYCDRLFTVGEKAKKYVNGFKSVKRTAKTESFGTTDEAFASVRKYIDGELSAGRTVAILVKGSHIMHMGRISQLLEEAYK
ncbi:MAG: UDP-N-acetylmuramoyl-tripeptide--D-alanyl-D-alanine ligase [Clostridia bacterium]|nr:UDP-N-acetylmuramoyl-tripeptide--D-alanyl-D-alanine ligase [Clostridia bacterium]